MRNPRLTSRATDETSVALSAVENRHFCLARTLLKDPTHCLDTIQEIHDDHTTN
jgi:hypothetical protein